MPASHFNTPRKECGKLTTEPISKTSVTMSGLMGAYLHVVLSLVVKREAFSSPLPFVIATPLTNAIDISPVFLLLWVLQWITVHLYSAYFNALWRLSSALYQQTVERAVYQQRHQPRTSTCRKGEHHLELSS